MKRVFSEEVENGRILEGRYGSHFGDGNGAFLVTCPLTNCILTLIVSDRSDWMSVHGTLPVWEHVSVSLQTRCPSWKEMCFVKDLFFEPEELVLQFHPPKSRYVNVHRNVLHLWRAVDVNILLPPVECV